MTNAKRIIDKLITTTNPAARYAAILGRYHLAPNYAKLTYHNAEHVRAVINLFAILRKLSNKSFDKQQVKSAELALAFHDINHTGHNDAYVDEDQNTNIGNASAAFYSWQDDKDLTLEERHAVLGYIAGTKFPYVQPEPEEVTVHTDPELLALVRDADILWGMLPGNAEHCLLGLALERQHAEGGPQKVLDMQTVLTNQLYFIRDYQPLSSAGRTFKNAMFDQATTAWSVAALEYMRQVETATVIRDMSSRDISALALALANRRRR